MKKILLTCVALAALATVSCSHKESAADAAASTLTTKIQNCTNPDSMKAYVEEAKAYAARLVSEGKVDEARKYLEKVEPVVKKYAPSLAGVVTTAENAADKL